MPQPTTQRKAKFNARRDQIINAARDCFRRHGFHGAGMAEIATLSELSVGQIYRYFTNKDAIIEEIVRRIVNNKMLMIARDETNLDRLAGDLAYRVIHGDAQTRDDDQALMLEVAAEATRNPVVALILQDADTLLFRQASDMLKRLYPLLSDTEIAARVELIAVMTEGTDFRMLTAQKVSPTQLHNLYKQILQNVFPPMDKS